MNIQSAYAQNMLGLLSKSIQIANTILEPAYIMRGVALDGIFSGHPALFNVYIMLEQHAREDIANGYRQIAKAIGQSYVDFIKDITIGAISFKTTLIKNTKWEIEFSLKDLIEHASNISSGNAGEKELLFLLKARAEGKALVGLYSTWKDTLVAGFKASNGSGHSGEVMAEAAKAFTSQFWK